MKHCSFISDLQSLQFDNVFNPYSDRCAIYDRPDAPERRSNMLSAMLTRAQATEVDAIWIGRDLGYRGGRRTGLALTDDAHIDTHLKRFGISAERPTIGSAVSERTAAVIWKLLERIKTNVFLWNVFPLHPHEAENPFTNRQHNVQERRVGEELLYELIEILRPRRIIAIGNDAATAVSRLAEVKPITGVRHPSYGGQNQFLAEMGKLYKLKSAPQQLSFVNC